jgi:hypothetical protein
MKWLAVYKNFGQQTSLSLDMGAIKNAVKNQAALFQLSFHRGLMPEMKEVLA